MLDTRPPPAVLQGLPGEQSTSTNGASWCKASYRNVASHDTPVLCPLMLHFVNSHASSAHTFFLTDVNDTNTLMGMLRSKRTHTHTHTHTHTTHTNTQIQRRRQPTRSTSWIDSSSLLLLPTGVLWRRWRGIDRRASMQHRQRLHPWDFGTEESSREFAGPASRPRCPYIYNTARPLQVGSIAYGGRCEFGWQCLASRS